jgi:antagonist of KipI
MSLTVLDPGLASRLVDMGRPRSRSLGVPVGGAADRRSLALGNSLVGNLPDAVALEITLAGPRLHAESDIGCVVFGAPFNVVISSGSARHSPPPFFTFTLKAGEDLYIGGTARGAHACLCVRGGFLAPPILRSRAALAPIRHGDVLSCAATTIGAHACPEVQPMFPDSAVFAVLPGLQAGWFDQAEFYEQTYAVTPESNRMGLRLKGKALSMPKREMVSEPVCPGAVQVTPDGQVIVLGVDGQTIGGYPKIAQVIQADLDNVGQLRPGQGLRFVPIALAEAALRYRATQAELREWCLRLRLSLDSFPA